MHGSRPLPVDGVAPTISPDDLGVPCIPLIAQRIAETGGRLLVVGGWVRDRLLGLPSKDLDVEILHPDPGQAEATLADFGEVTRVGRAFDVLLVRGVRAEFSITGSALHESWQEGFQRASRRRDLTLNSLGWDPLTGDLLDPHGGVEDLRAGRLRETDRGTFGADPLRGLRVAQLAARFEMAATPSLHALCETLDLEGLPAERVYEELRKLLLKSKRPSVGLALLHSTGLLRFFPELQALVGVAQDPRWHPEGCVWTHTLMVVDAAAGLRIDQEGEDLLLLWAALCHDLGKPVTTRTQTETGAVTAHSHEQVGEALSQQLLARLRAPIAVVAGVGALVRHHLAPVTYAGGATPAGASAYRRLARKLAEAGVHLALLERVARADQLGRTTATALAGNFPEGDRFLTRARELSVERSQPPDVVQGRDLLARGLSPGPNFGRLLRGCRVIQDETGWTDSEAILDRALREDSASADEP